MHKTLLDLVVLIALIFIPGSAHGQDRFNLPIIGDFTFDITIPEPLTALTLEKGIGLLGLILHVAYIIFFVLAALMIIFTAIDYLRSGGDDTKVRAAQSKLIYIFIAIAIALLSSVASGFVKNILERGGSSGS